MNKNKLIAKTEALAYYKDKYYFVPTDFNYLFEVDKRLEVFRPLVRIEESRCDFLYSTIMAFEDKLFLIPKLAERIAIYDIKKKALSYLAFRSGNLGKNRWSTFLSAQIVGSYLCLIPAYYPNVVRINYKSLDISQKRITDTEYACDGTSLVVGNDIWIPVKDKKNVVIYTPEDESISHLFVEGLKKPYSYTYDLGESVLLISRDLKEPMIRYNINKSEWEYIYNKIKISNIACFGREIDGSFFIIANEFGEVIVIDRNIECRILKNNNLIKCLDSLEIWEKNIRQITLFKKDKKLFSVNGETGEWYYYDNDSWYNVVLPKNTRYEDCIRLEHSILPLI